MINANRIASCILTAAMVVVGPAWAQENTHESKADQERALRDAERQMRDAERQMRDAERALRDAARAMAALKAKEAYDGQLARKVVVFGDNARLGIVLQTRRDPKTDAVGAVVQALTPGGPAEEAGLQAGDIIVSFNGEPIGRPAGRGDEEGESPSDRLMERASALKEGDRVTLEVKRGNETKTIVVTARKLYGSRVKVFTVPDIEVPDIEIPDVDVHVDVEPFRIAEELKHGAGVLAWTPAASDLREIEMVALNPDLGEYFGATEGILVISAPKDSLFQLKAGDVILKIGDREPRSPAQAMRVLRSYGPTETVTIEVVRQRARMTLTAHIPERRSFSYSFGGDPAAPSAPPAPPAPAAKAAPPAPPARRTV
jgi:C-terminal processing protease CtpA/Prc